jgi:oligogalacturonide lyase
MHRKCWFKESWTPNMLPKDGKGRLSGQLLLLLPLLLTTAWAQDPPREWIDPDTGHRVVRLSNEPGSSSFYFHQNRYTANGDKMVFSTREGLSVLDLKTHKITPLVEGVARNTIVGRKTRQVFYLREDTVYATNIDTGETRTIVKQAALRSGSGFAVNADETLLAGSLTEGQSEPEGPPEAGQGAPRKQEGDDNPPGKGIMMERRLAAHIPMALFTINIKSGEVKTFNHCTDWLNHVQFSPTDPDLILFSHEGPWHKVDRIWTIHTDGTGLRKMHSRTMEMEIAGHEFFNPDGKIIWYDLQTPKGKEFWLGGVVLATGKTIRYKIQKSEWSVHFNVAPDGKLFAGDGGGPNSVAAPDNGQWIYLFTPEKGELKAEKLVNLAKHNYHLEPNVTFTPDGKWIVFRSNMFGPTQIYAVEVQKTKTELKSKNGPEPGVSAFKRKFQ